MDCVKKELAAIWGSVSDKFILLDKAVKDFREERLIDHGGKSREATDAEFYFSWVCSHKWLHKEFQQGL